MPGGSGPYQYGIIDWPADMRYDTVVTGNGAEIVVNAQAVGANRSVAQAAAVLDDQPDASTYNGHADDLTAAINAKLYDPGNGLYSDGLATDTLTPIANYSQHAQTYAVAYGIAPVSQYATLGQAIADAGMRQGPMDLRQLEDALARTGRSAALVDLLTNPGQDGPAKVLAEGGTFMWEQWTPGCSVASCTGSEVSQSANDSMSHGWGSAGVVGILQSLLGITVTGAGASSVLIAPPASGLSHARGTQWTERGPVTVDWRHAGETISVEVTLPVNVTATVVVAGHSTTVGSGRTHLVFPTSGT
jgi:hypothetical protein